MRDALRRFVRPTRDERARQRTRDVWIVIIGSYALLAFAYLWPPDGETRAAVPVEWAGFMIRVLQFHLGLLVAATVAYAALRREARAVLAAMPLLAFTLGPVCWTYLDGEETHAATGASTRVMTANLLVSNDEHAAMVREITNARPDVLVLQEYSEAWASSLQDGLGDEFPHSAAQTRDDSFGTAVFSRDELSATRDSEYVSLGSTDAPQTRTVIKVGREDVALYNIHLLPPISRAYVREGGRQFDDLVGIVEAEDLPVIVVGDLNLTETTPQHARLREIGLRDAWDVAGRGRGATWPNNSFLRHLPGLRLDHVYVSKELSVVDVRIGEGRGSDHRPVVADLAIRT